MNDIAAQLDDYIKRILAAGEDLTTLQTFIAGDESIKVLLRTGESIPSLKGLVAESMSSLTKARAYVDNQNRELRDQLRQVEQRLGELERRGR